MGVVSIDWQFDSSNPSYQAKVRAVLDYIRGAERGRSGWCQLSDSSYVMITDDSAEEVYDDLYVDLVLATEVEPPLAMGEALTVLGLAKRFRAAGPFVQDWLAAHLGDD
jgi:hypothetical protein